MLDRVKFSKFLSLVLRHDPAAADVTLDESGWCDVEALIRGARCRGFEISRRDVDDIVANNDKKRFTFNDDGTLIRASQGRSLAVDVRPEQRVPPETLYHGTVERVLDAIRQQGLKKMSRLHVHLSADVESARRVGARRGRPVVLGVRALSMHHVGSQFFLSANGVWLVESVPPQFIVFP